MHVALDATPLTLSSGGLRRYTEELSRALADEYPGDVYAFLSDQRFDLPAGCPANCRKGDAPLANWWWSAGVSVAMRRTHASLFHGTNFEVPYLNLRPSVLTLHDLSPWRDRVWHTGADRVRNRTPWLLRLGIATMVITPTEAIRREAIEYFGIAPERVVAVPHGPAYLRAAEVHGRPERPYFLFVGTTEPRKNVHLLLDAWRTLRADFEADLVLAGRRRSDGPVFANEPGLRVLGEVNDAELARLYAGAIAFVYPSHYEGFGLPVLEAMQCGAAVVTSDDPALLEVGGDAVLRINSSRELASVMAKLLTNPAFGEEYRERARRRASEFSWRRTARLTHAVYEEAIARFG